MCSRWKACPSAERQQIGDAFAGRRPAVRLLHPRHRAARQGLTDEDPSPRAQPSPKALDGTCAAAPAT
jgi:hypothetical protein